jgi:hypothetical protein
VQVERRTERTFSHGKLLFVGEKDGVLLSNVPPLLVSCEVRNFLFSVKDKNSCETQT